MTNPLCLMNKRLLGNLSVLLRRRHEFAMERAERYADQVAATGIADVLLTGDFSSTSTPEEFEMAASFVRGLQRRGLRVHLVPGNHDVYTFESVRKRRFEQFFAEFLPAEGYPSALTLPGGTRLVLVDSVCPRFLTARGRIAAAQLERLKALLEAASSPLLLAMHYPLLPRTSGYHSDWTHVLANADALLGMLRHIERPVLHVAGHVHRFSYVADPVIPTLHHLTTAAFFRTKSGEAINGVFSEIRVHNDGFCVYSHVCREAWTREERQPADL